jgi:arabinogalactan endo-1,4-beta-galactosidase
MQIRRSSTDRTRSGTASWAGNNALSSAFYAQLTSPGVPFDVIVLSYYPFFHGAGESAGQDGSREMSVPAVSLRACAWS